MDWERVDELFAGGELLSAPDRDALLASADPPEADQVRRLWKSAEEAGAFLSASLIARAEPAAHYPGQLVAGRFTLIRLMGAGGMGEVFSARDGRLGRVVALKFIRPELAASPEARKRLQREARALCSLIHPSICTLHDLVWDGDEPLLVMECMEGETLDARLHQGSLAGPTLVSIALEVLEGLDSVHRAGLVHRDLKPANVMLTARGAKLFDFGIARWHAPPAGEGIESGRLMIGSVSYMSPEQVTGRSIDVRSDIFGVGCLLYEMATGHKAFDRGSEISTVAAILEGEPPAMRTKAPDLPETFVAAVARCLRKDPAQRYQTVSELLAALRPLGATLRDVDRRPASADGSTPPAMPHVVGRKWERATLHKALADADSGRPGMLIVSGEAGIGKTTIVEGFLDDVRNRSLAVVARGRCSERLAGGEAYLPILEVLESLLLDGAPGLEARRVMSDVAPTWYAQLAPPSRELEIANKGSSGPLQTASQERMKRELRGLLDTLSRFAPLVLFLDDLHWADISTVDMLSYLCSRFEAMRVLVIVTYRPTELLLSRHPFANLKLDLAARGLCRELPLGFLTRDEAERYLDLAYPGHHFPRELAEVVHARTEGSPLFMVDLVRDLRDRGLIASTPEGWTLARSIPAIERDLPHKVGSMIARKIGQLSESDRQLLVCASVQGYTFDSAVVAAALGRDPGEIEERLEQLERVYAFIHVLGEDVLSSGGLTLRCQFVHVLYQDELHASIRATRRAAMSAAVAEAVIRLHGWDLSAKASELAVLFAAARQPIQAARAFLAAANNALRVYAYVEAASSAERGLAQLAQLPAADERDELELKLHVLVGTTRIAIGGYAAPQVKRDYERERELCRRIGNPRELASVLFGLFCHYAVVPPHEVCLELGLEMLRLAEREQSPSLRIQGLLMQGTTRFWMGEVAPSVALLEEGIAICDQARHAIVGETPLFDHGVACRRYQAVALWLAGYPDRALVRLREAVEDARRTKHPLTMAPTLGFAAALHYFRREVPETAATSQEAVACSREFGLTNWVHFAGAFHGWAAAHQVAPRGEGSDPASAAIGEIVACMDWQTEASTRRFRSIGSALLAEAHLKQGAIDEATLAIDEGLRVAAETGEGFLEAELHRLHGEVAFHRGEVQRAEELYERAIALATKRQENSLTLRALTSLMKLVRAQPSRSSQSEVRTRLGEIYEWFTQGFETHDLLEARRLLQNAE